MGGGERASVCVCRSICQDLPSDKVCVWEYVRTHVNAYMLVSLCMSTDVKM